MTGLRMFIREKKWKKLRKDQWLILFLAGVLLLLVATPASCGSASQGKAGAAKEEQTETKGEEASADYTEALEARLAQALSQMDGVGKAEVMIMLEDGGEAVVEKDVSTTGDAQTNTTGEGAVTEQTETERQEETVYSPQSQGEPFVSREILPRIEGVLVIAEGGGNTETVKNISEAVEALFGLEAHKIKVVKMNSQEGYH